MSEIRTRHRLPSHLRVRLAGLANDAGRALPELPIETSPFQRHLTGASQRVYGCGAEAAMVTTNSGADALLICENHFGLTWLDT